MVSNRESKKLCFMVMQNTGNQLFTESVLDEVFISLPKHSKNKNDVAMNILRQFDLDFLAHRHPHSLSGRQKQRLAIACTLATGREILALRAD
ncbi:MAG: ATP-binding cassette domain-containing protein [Lactobacillus iners]|uniref:ATP-binding cassette domain-containing protein n=1 Tax=Lactobacillus iners TaxID=147802 RepID=UPI0027E5A6A5|nr:ATP-binding cassette domain-containing protein [Lactobacillus iners]MCT7771417.1 ATP-binding cassette domain-containing protein [Lactobacillus iners]MCT7842188.1 ATP-binding cassette domain-containing protein [Lactobacillus iners]